MWFRSKHQPIVIYQFQIIKMGKVKFTPITLHLTDRSITHTRVGGKWTNLYFLQTLLYWIMKQAEKFIILGPPFLATMNVDWCSKRKTKYECKWWTRTTGPKWYSNLRLIYPIKRLSIFKEMKLIFKEG